MSIETIYNECGREHRIKVFDGGTGDVYIERSGKNGCVVIFMTELEAKHLASSIYEYLIAKEK